MRFAPVAPIAAALLLFCSFDNPQGLPWRPSSAPSPDVLVGMKIPVLPNFGPAQQSQPAAESKPSNSSSPNASNGQSQGEVKNVSDTESKSGSLKQPAELALVRYVDGEDAYAVRLLPIGKEGFIMHMQKPFDESMLN